jgi:hypothetical protein
MITVLKDADPNIRLQASRNRSASPIRTVPAAVGRPGRRQSRLVPTCTPTRWALAGSIRPFRAGQPLPQELQRIAGLEGEDLLRRVVIEQTCAAGPPRPDNLPRSDGRPARRADVHRMPAQFR